MHKLEIDSPVKLEDVWSIEKPEGFEVNLAEPLRKSVIRLDGIEQAIDLLMPIVVTLKTNFPSWASERTFDGFWHYLKSFVTRAPKGDATKAKLTIHASDGAKFELELPLHDASVVDGVRARFQERITHADGTLVEREIKIERK